MNNFPLQCLCRKSYKKKLIAFEYFSSFDFLIHHSNCPGLRSHSSEFASSQALTRLFIFMTIQFIDISLNKLNKSKNRIQFIWSHIIFRTLYSSPLLKKEEINQCDSSTEFIESIKADHWWTEQERRHHNMMRYIYYDSNFILNKKKIPSNRSFN